MSTDSNTLDVLLAQIAAHRSAGDAVSLVCIDGPAGSGKTTLAAQLVRELHAQIVHMDDLYDGWEGVERGVEILVTDVLTPLFRGGPADYRRYDWVLERYAESHQVEPLGCLIVEGCASATKIVDKFDPFIVWVETEPDVRLARGLARDGEEVRDQWLKFMDRESQIYEANNTRERAHVHLDGFGQIVEVRG